MNYNFGRNIPIEEIEERLSIWFHSLSAHVAFSCRFSLHAEPIALYRVSILERVLVNLAILHNKKELFIII